MLFMNKVFNKIPFNIEYIIISVDNKCIFLAVANLSLGTGVRILFRNAFFLSVPKNQIFFEARRIFFAVAIMGSIKQILFLFFQIEGRVVLEKMARNVRLTCG